MQAPADGYPGIADLALLSDRRTAALVSRDGTVEWLCLPAFDGPPVFSRLIDVSHGGHCTVAPDRPFQARRRYVPDTNVLETTFTTDDGVVRVTDALTWAPADAHGEGELVRRVEGLSGRTPMRWTVRPTGGYELRSFEPEPLGGHHVLRDGANAITVQAWDMGEPSVAADGLEGVFDCVDGRKATIAIRAFFGQPMVIDPRDGIERRLDQTIERWKQWAARCEYGGPYADAVARSALVLAALTHEPSGAMVAAPTTSLPERVGGDRNYDYRFSWLRDTNLGADALLRVGYRDDVHASLRWLMAAEARTHPRLRPFYSLDTSPGRNSIEVDLHGYRGTRPVRVGNGAAGQLQLGTYGDLLATAWLWVDDGHYLDGAAATRLAEATDFMTLIWRREDAGFWELPNARHYTGSKLSCWEALRNAIRLAERGDLPAAGAQRWRQVVAEVRDFVEGRCWSPSRNCYVAHADADGLDAVVLLGSRMGYHQPDHPRLRSTVAAVRSELSAGGPLLYRTSELRGHEGAFVACSFWLVEALARQGDVEEAAALMEDLLGHANDVGLYSEEIDPQTGEFLGNVPQALSHMALINAAVQLDHAARPSGR